jgi:hypothetical protein
MNKYDDPTPPSKIRELHEDPAYIEAAREGADEILQRPLNVDALLAGINFLHDFVQTPKGKRAVKRALGENFVHLMPGVHGTTWVIPRLLWRDSLYDGLSPGHGGDVSVGIQVARLMIWGPPGFHKKHNGHSWDAAISEAINRFEAGQRDGLPGQPHPRRPFSRLARKRVRHG